MFDRGKKKKRNLPIGSSQLRYHKTPRRVCPFYIHRHLSFKTRVGEPRTVTVMKTHTPKEVDVIAFCSNTTCQANLCVAAIIHPADPFPPARSLRNLSLAPFKENAHTGGQEWSPSPPINTERTSDARRKDTLGQRPPPHPLGHTQICSCSEDCGALCLPYTTPASRCKFVCYAGGFCFHS